MHEKHANILVVQIQLKYPFLLHIYVCIFNEWTEGLHPTPGRVI